MKIKHLEMKVDKVLKKDGIKDIVDPVRLGRDGKFTFRCHPGVTCFTRCCRNMNIILTPYDIIRIKDRLGLSSDMFLQLYAQPEILKETGIPVARLKMLDHEKGRCPFVSGSGCQIYSDRPVCCRYYPIGMASLHQQGRNSDREEEFFFIVRENHCKGFQEPVDWTVDSWRADQEADLYDSMNRGWMELMLRKRSFGPDTEMPEKARRLFYMVTTNMEKFRHFIFESRFLDTYEVDEQTLKEILNDDTALMKFGFEYLKYSIFGAETPAIRLKKAVLDKTINKILKNRRKKQKKGAMLNK